MIGRSAHRSQKDTKKGPRGDGYFIVSASNTEVKQRISNKTPCCSEIYSELVGEFLSGMWDVGQMFPHMLEIVKKYKKFFDTTLIV